MPAEPPRQTIHVVQHLLLDGVRILREQLSPTIADAEVQTALDRAIEELSPMEGMPIRPNAARLYGLAHALRTLVEDIEPYKQPRPVDLSGLAPTLRRVEERLLEERAQEAQAQR